MIDSPAVEALGEDVVQELLVKAVVIAIDVLAGTMQTLGGPALDRDKVAAAGHPAQGDPIGQPRVAHAAF